MSVTNGQADTNKLGQTLARTIISDSEDHQTSDSDHEEKHVPEDHFHTLIKSEVEHGDESSGSENNPDGYRLEGSTKNRKTFDRPCAQAILKVDGKQLDVSLAVSELVVTGPHKKLPQRKAREKGRKFLLALLKNEKEDSVSDNGEVDNKTDVSNMYTERKKVSRKTTPEGRDKIKLKPGRKLSHSSMKIGPSGARRKKRVIEMTEEERERVRSQWKEQKLRQRERLSQSKLERNEHPTPKMKTGKKNVPEMSTEEYRAKLAEHSRRRRERMTPEKKEEYLRKAKEYKKRRLALMTPDQRREMRQGWTINKIAKIAKMTEEEKSAYEFQQFTKRLERRFRQRERRQIEWDSLTEAEKEERMEKRRRYARERWRDPQKKAAMMECSKRAREKMKKDPEKVAKLKLINRSYKMKRALGQLPWQQEGGEEIGHGHRWGCRKYPNESEAEREKREKEMRRQRGGRSKQAEVGGECRRKSNSRNESQEERENRLMKARITRAKNILRKRLVADGALPDEIEAKLKEVASSAKAKDKKDTSESQKQSGDQAQIPLEVQSSKTNDFTSSQIIVLEIAPPRPYTDTPSTEISSFSFVPASPSPTDFEVVIEPPGQPFLQFHFQTPIESDSTFSLSQTLPEAFCLFDTGNTQDTIPHIIPNFCFTVEDKQVECTASDNNINNDNQSILIPLPCSDSSEPDSLNIATNTQPEIPNPPPTVTAPVLTQPLAALVTPIKKAKKGRRAADPSKLKRAKGTYGPRGSRTKSSDVADDPKLMVVCDICGNSYKSTYFKDHLRFQHNPNYKDGACLLCGGKYTNSKAFRRHFVSVHMEKAAKDKEKPFMCPDCGHSYSLESNLRSHIYYRHGEGLKSHNYFKCEHCPKSFKMEMGYRKHVKFVHPEHYKDKKTAKHLACNTCDKVCPTQLEFLEHFKEAHPELECHPCKFCSAVCFTTAGLLFHYYNCRKLHSRGEARKLMKEFPSDILRIVNAKLNCEFCKRECVSASLSRHYFEVHGIKEQRSFYCWLCPKVFKVRDFLVYHLIDRHFVQWTEELRRKVAKVIAEEGVNIQNPEGKLGGIEGNTKKKQKIIEKRIAEGRPPRQKSAKKEEKEDKTKTKRSRGRPKKDGSEMTNFPTNQPRVLRKRIKSKRKPIDNRNTQNGKDKRLTSLTSQEGDPNTDKRSDIDISNSQVKTEHDVEDGETDNEIEKKKRLVIELERVKIEDIDYCRSFSPAWLDYDPTVKEEEGSSA